ncbi:SETMR methyltransferase, partial [Acromyrmex heyeri]
INEFKRGRTCDACRSGHPIEAATPEIIDKVHNIILTDRRVKMCELVEATGISHGNFARTISILHEQLDEFLRRFITHTINDDYYAALLDYFNNILKKKRPHLAKKKVLFHQDNARVHTCLAPIAKFNEFRYKLLPHPAYSPDLAPCDYFPFPNLKKWFGGKRFTTREQLIAETEAYF